MAIVLGLQDSNTITIARFAWVDLIISCLQLQCYRNVAVALPSVTAFGKPKSQLVRTLARISDAGQN